MESIQELLRKLCQIDGLEWIRILYTYPEEITDELVKVIKEEDKICKYIDIRKILYNRFIYIQTLIFYK